MISIVKLASAAVFAFGLMGCATEGIGGQAKLVTADVAGYHPSPNDVSVAAVQPPSTVTGKVGNRGLENATALNSDTSFGYHPDSNARPLAVQPPAVVTGKVGNRGLENVTAQNSDTSFGYHPSPNERPLAVQPPAVVTGAVGSGASMACVEGDGMVGVSPNARLCP